MQLTNLKHLFFDQYWFLLLLLGIIILIWFINRDSKTRNEVIGSQMKVNEERENSYFVNDGNEGVVLINSEFKLLGANSFFYLLTGLKEVAPDQESIQFLNRIFSSENRDQQGKSLMQLLQVGKGTMEATIQHVNGKLHDMAITVFEIRHEKGTVVYCVTIHENE